MIGILTSCFTHVINSTGNNLAFYDILNFAFCTLKCALLFSYLWDDHVKDVLDFSKEPTMIRRELLGSRAILAVVSVVPPSPGKHLFSTHTDTKATRQHLGRLEATVLEPSISLFSSLWPLPLKPTFPSIHVHNQFLQRPSHIAIQEK